MQQIITILFLLLVELNIALADDECNVRTSSRLVNQRKVGQVTNLVKNTEVDGRCEVSFDIVVDGEEYSLNGAYEGLEQMASLCHYAVNNARTELLVGLGGVFDTESATTCKEGDTDLVDNIKIGDTILENEVGSHKVKKYFRYKDTRCRMFTQRLVQNRELKVYNGVICEVENSATNWIVVDKW